MDVYRIQTSLDITGNVARELMAILGSMERVEGHARGVKTHIDSWGGAIRHVLNDVRSLSRAMGRLGGNSRRVSPLQSLMGFSAAEATRELNELARAMGRIGRGGRRGPMANPLGFNAAEVAAEITRMNEALRGVRTGNGGASRSFSSWAGSLERAATAAERMDRALAGVRAHAPGGSPIRLSGGGATGGGRGGSRSHRNHGAEREVHSILAGGAAVGMPTGLGHYLTESVKEAGHVYDQSIMQGVQGTSNKRMAQLPADIAANRALAFEYALKNGYATPSSMMKGITDAADMGKGDFHEARIVAPSIARLSALANVVGDEEMHTRVNDKGQNRALARALDQMGLTKDPERMNQYLPMIERGIVGTRGIFNGKELLNFVQHSGGEATNVSPEFVGGVLPMLTEALKGGPLGDSYNQMVKHLYKGTTTGWSETKTLLDMGFIKESDLIRNPVNGKVTKDFRVGAIEGSKELLGTQGKGDLFKFYTDVIKPKLEGPKGAQFGKTMEERTENFVETITKNKGYARMFKEFAVNEDQIKANIERFKNQGNPMDLLNKTLSGSLKQLTNSIETFTTVLGDSKVSAAVTGLNALSEGIRHAAASLFGDPTTANKVFGGLAAGGAGAATVGGISLLSMAFAVGGPVSVFLGGLVAAGTYWAATDWQSFAKASEVARPTIENTLKDLQGLMKIFDFISEKMSKLTGANDDLLGTFSTKLLKMLGFNPEEAKKAAEAQKGVAEGAEKITEKAPESKSWLERLGDAIARLGLASMMAESGVQKMSLSISGLAGALGGGGSGIQKASFGGGGLGGGLGGKGVPDFGGGAGGSGSSAFDAIMRAEGTAGKDPYNVVLGKGKYGLPDKPLTDMTLREVYAFGRKVRARHGSSSALGAFQIVGRTMKQHMGAVGLGWDDKFTPENQRKLARDIARTEGLRAWEGFKKHPGERAKARSGGWDYHAPSSTVPHAPPPSRTISVQNHMHVDGQRLASIMSHHQFRSGNRPATGANVADNSELYPVVG